MIAAAACLAAGCQVIRSGPLDAQASDEWTRSYDLAPGGEVQVVGAVGSVDVQGGGQRVEVKAERVARASTDATARDILPRIQIREDVSPDKIVLQTEGLSGIVIGVEVMVNYRITVPARTRVRVRTANGPVTIANVDGRVVASSANGQIVGRNLTGGVEARAVNQSISIDLGALGQDPVDVRATNGRVDLSLPSDIDASLLVNCTNGTIDVRGLPFEAVGDQTPRRLRGRFNKGGTPIELNAVNGDVRVHPRL